MLARCPCGGIPESLSIIDNGQGGKWANAVPDCCGEWMIEFRTQYFAQDSRECMELAIDAWNAAPRMASGGVMDAYEQTDRQAECCDLERL